MFVGWMSLERHRLGNIDRLVTTGRKRKDLIEMGAKHLYYGKSGAHLLFEQHYGKDWFYPSGRKVMLEDVFNSL